MKLFTTRKELILFILCLAILTGWMLTLAYINPVYVKGLLVQAYQAQFDAIVACYPKIPMIVCP